MGQCPLISALPWRRSRAIPHTSSWRRAPLPRPVSPSPTPQHPVLSFDHASARHRIPRFGRSSLMYYGTISVCDL
jgi:hypothetical protein